MLYGRHDRNSDPVILNHGAQFMRSECDRQSNHNAAAAIAHARLLAETTR
jgi:hypothetical protein